MIVAANSLKIYKSADPMGELADLSLVNFEENEQEFAFREVPKVEEPKDYLSKLLDLFRSPHQPLKAFETCTTQVDRLKRGPVLQNIQDMHIWLGENLP